MKIHLGWIRMTATAAIVAGASASPVAAQYAPYRPLPQPVPPVQQTAAQPVPATAQPPYNSAYWPQAAQPRVASRYAIPATPQYPQTTAPYVPATAAASQTSSQYPAASQTTTPQYPTTTQSPASGYPSYPYVAQNEAPPAPADANSMPAPAAPNGVNGHANAHAANGHAAVVNGGNGDCGCANGYPAGSYYNGDAGCESGDRGLSSYFDKPRGNTQWFGGVYWLFMERDDPDFRRFTAQFDTPAGGYPYYPTADVTVLSTPDVDHNYRSGFEVRFGSTLGGGGGYDSCDSSGHYGNGCGCEPCAAPSFAWELGYWFLDDDDNTEQVVDAIPNDTYRMYGMKNFAGLQYNGEPVNLWYDYQVPVEDPAGPPPWGTGTLVRVLAQRVRSNFQAQNLELNFLRLPLCGAACGPSYASHGGNHCDGCETEACAPACGSPFSVTTLGGVRYLRLDDDFEYATMWAVDDGTGTLTPPAYTPWDGAGELYYDIDVDNQLVGFQLGANMNYCVSCKWNLFWNTNFGLYNNHIESSQRVYGELGPATWVGSGEDAEIEADKDDVAFVGEILLGGSYQFTCNWRGILAYRAVAISGVALSVDQMPEDFSNEAEVALIDSDGSLIIHGVQVGAECRY